MPACAWPPRAGGRSPDLAPPARPSPRSGPVNSTAGASPYCSSVDHLLFKRYVLQKILSLKNGRIVILAYLDYPHRQSGYICARHGIACGHVLFQLALRVSTTKQRRLETDGKVQNLLQEAGGILEARQQLQAASMVVQVACVWATAFHSVDYASLI